MKPIEDIDSYINSAPKHTRALLEQMRGLIQKAAPTATECISYAMPAFTAQRRLVYFAAFAHHIGFYPGAAAIAAFKKDFGAYKWAKGSVQFPVDQPLPAALITKIVKFCVKQERARVKAK